MMRISRVFKKKVSMILQQVKTTNSQSSVCESAKNPYVDSVEMFAERSCHA